MDGGEKAFTWTMFFIVVIVCCITVTSAIYSHHKNKMFIEAGYERKTLQGTSILVWQAPDSK